MLAFGFAHPFIRPTRYSPAHLTYTLLTLTKVPRMGKIREAYTYVQFLVRNQVNLKVTTGPQVKPIKSLFQYPTASNSKVCFFIRRQ